MAIGVCFHWWEATFWLRCRIAFHFTNIWSSGQNQAEIWETLKWQSAARMWGARHEATCCDLLNSSKSTSDGKRKRWRAEDLDYVCIEMQKRWVVLPSLLPLRVMSEEMLWVPEPKESKLSRESSLQWPPAPPPSSLSWKGSSRSAHQLSPKPLSLTLTLFGPDDSCRAFYSHTNTHRHSQSDRLASNIYLSGVCGAVEVWPRAPAHWVTGHAPVQSIRDDAFTDISVKTNRVVHRVPLMAIYSLRTALEHISNPKAPLTGGAKNKPKRENVFSDL